MIVWEDLNYYFYFNSYQFWNDFVDMGYAKKTKNKRLLRKQPGCATDSLSAKWLNLCHRVVIHL